MTLCAHSTSCFRWQSLRFSPSAIRCASGIGSRSHSVLIFINDLPDNIRSSVHLFTDDCVLYRNIQSLPDCLTLQEYLTSLGQCEADWQMKFNVAKCHSMRVTRHQDHKQICIHQNGMYELAFTEVSECAGWCGLLLFAYMYVLRYHFSRSVLM